MKKYKSRYLSFYFMHAITLCLLTACSFDYQSFPPFCISKPIIILDKAEELETSCNLFFTIKNTDKRTIERISFVFSSYESCTGKIITAKVSNEILMDIHLEWEKTDNIFVNLEPIIFKIPDSVKRKMAKIC